ncbi:hypothetical protein PRUPE_3G137200 [Prunus persica]|uniref:tRNA-uridine aminocarboxypropyltransferase n=1 Tax=Prunus persica TaxID=3760 RepID=A0A251PZU7_PRUPE|nr:hypothetical protein PRUPE_3G137200 [Prunus persica]
MASPRAFTFKCSPSLAFSTKTLMDSKPRTLRSPFSCSTSGSPQREARLSDAVEGAITLQEWQGWGTTSPLPAMVTKIVEDLKALEKDIDAQMSFGGSGGKLQCWLPLEDCMCSNVTQSTLWHRMRFWLYMHPKDFLRQNNTGKLLWQVFGTEAATLCLFGISEHEEIMWNALKLAGKKNVWCLYPNKNAALKSVEDVFGQEPSPYLECTDTKDQATSVWGEADFPCISLATGVSAMHKLRPQPSWDRTCTAGAAIGLLSELQLLPEFSSFGFDKQAEALEDTLVILLEALTTRRVRMGRSITRKVRHMSGIC